MIKIYFKEIVEYYDHGCSCCEDIYIESLAFSHIEGVENSEKYQSYDYEMYNGSKSSEWDCLASVFWDLVADKEQYEDFYYMCENLYNVEESEIKLMLLSKGIEVVFIDET